MKKQALISLLLLIPCCVYADHSSGWRDGATESLYSLLLGDLAAAIYLIRPAVGFPDFLRLEKPITLVLFLTMIVCASLQLRFYIINPDVNFPDVYFQTDIRVLVMEWLLPIGITVAIFREGRYAMRLVRKLFQAK